MRPLRMRPRSSSPNESDMASPEVIEMIDDVFIEVARRVIHSAAGPVLAAITRDEPLEQIEIRGQ